MFKTSMRAFSVAAILTVGSASLVHAQSAEDIAIQEALVALDASLPGKLINNPYDIKWSTIGSDKREKIVQSEGAPGGTAYSVTVKKRKQNHWDTATRIPMTTDIPKGDTILVSFWARAAKPQKGKDKGQIVVVLQRNIDPYDSIFEENIDLGKEWKLYSVAGTAERNYSADKTNLNFNLAKAKQTIEFGQFYVMNLGPNADASKYLN